MTVVWRPSQLGWVGLTLICLGVSGLGVAPAAAQPSPFQARVIEVVDGDTVHLQSPSGLGDIKARLLGIDAPEICQEGGGAAKDALTRRIQGLMVMVESNRQDDYGRALARIYLNGEDVGGWMVKQGMAWSYGARGSKGPYRLEELQARATQRGLFSNDQAMKPSDFRRKYQPCHGEHAGQLKRRRSTSR